MTRKRTARKATTPTVKDLKRHPRELELGDKGRIVIPAEFRKALGLRKGERLVIGVNDDEELRITTVARALDRASGRGFGTPRPVRSED